MSVIAPECVVCAWRATCNLKFMYEGSSALHCPEFTRDVSIKSKADSPYHDISSVEDKKVEKKQR